MDPAVILKHPGIITEEVGDTDANRGVRVVVAALVVGPNIKRVRALTGVAIDWLQNASWYLRRSGLWAGDRPSNYRLDYRWVEETGDRFHVGLLMDALVAAGRAVSEVTEEGERVYRGRDFGDFTEHGVIGVSWAEWVGADRREARRLNLQSRRRYYPAPHLTPNLERPRPRHDPRPWCPECGASDKHDEWCTQKALALSSG